MSKIVEIYPDIESVKLQAEARKAFGWKSEVSVNDRGVYEVTFIRDDSKAENKKLGELENEFMQCSVAQDYIERYSRVSADKKKFKAFPTIVLLILIYCIIPLGVLAAVSCLFKIMYVADPNVFYDLGINVTVGEETVPLTPDWKTVVDLESLGLYGFASMLGVKDKMLTVTVDLLIDLLFGLGLAAGVGLFLIIFFMIRKTLIARVFYKAEVEYLQKRKTLLASKLEGLDDRMDEIMAEVKKVKAKRQKKTDAPSEDKAPC